MQRHVCDGVLCSTTQQVGFKINQLSLSSAKGEGWLVRNQLFPSETQERGKKHLKLYLDQSQLKQPQKDLFGLLTE